VPAPGDPFLSVERVSRRYGGVTAVDGVDLAVRRHELLGIIGPNGAGKTTLFNLITGFTPPTGGQILFRGRRIDRIGAHRIARLGVSRTFQNLRVFPNLTVFDNVSVGAIGIAGFPAWRALLPYAGRARAKAITERSWQALERVGLAERAALPAASLPYGQRKYLEIARALATGPELLILDEPAAGLNETETNQLAVFVRGLNDSGITVLLVEHDMGLVMGTCQRVVVLAAGRKIADGTPAQVRADPAVQQAYLGTEDD
jgi:branched-chain amino acid transport system ATP-binding protein